MSMGYTCGMNKKNVALKIRVEEELRRDFIEVCRSEDMTAAQVVRKFMRGYIAQNRGAVKGNLNKTAKKNKNRVESEKKYNTEKT